MRGYKPTEDVRYALSSDEFVLEVRDRAAPKGISRVKRICQTLTKQIDVPTSEVQLLVDFIVIKLSKQEKGAGWNSFGYDIKSFTIPERGQMKSNFLKCKIPEPVVTNTSAVEEVISEPEPVFNEEEKAQKRSEEIAKQI